MALSLRWHYPGQVLRVAPIRRGLSAWLSKLPFSPMLFSFAQSVSRLARRVNAISRLAATRPETGRYLQEKSHVTLSIWGFGDGARPAPKDAPCPQRLVDGGGDMSRWMDDYPVKFDVYYPEVPSRGLALLGALLFLKGLLLIPHVIVL